MALKEIEIILNGLKETIPEGVSITQLIEISDESDTGVIVEVNRKFISAREYPITFLSQGDKVEFIYAACGG